MYLQGEGIEIEGLHNPLLVPPSVRVRYVQRLPVERLRQQYPDSFERCMIDERVQL